MAVLEIRPVAAEPTTAWKAGTFRGLTAAASLKLFDNNMNMKGNPTFRGLTAAASLKLHVPARSQLMSVAFRGLTAAASLKLREQRDRDVRIPHLPRPHRRGLIEAEGSGHAGRRKHPLPRPHRRGLIEACEPHHQPEPRSTFRGLTAAASLKQRILG